jgi:hypothetical protein
MGSVYVAIGDSMSIDDYAGGPGRGAASLLYRNHDVDFPDWAGRDLVAAGYTAKILARDGATADDVLRRQSGGWIRSGDVAAGAALGAVAQRRAGRSRRAARRRVG